MTIVGGLRRRLIKDNLYNMIYGALGDLNWFSSSSLVTNPVTFIAEQVDIGTEIKPNMVSLSAEEMFTDEMEMGSTLDQYSWDIYIDIFAEDESTGIHLSGDIYDILAGKFGSIGRRDAVFDVYNLIEDGEPYLFTCHIDDIEIARVREWDRKFNKYWWTISFTVLDNYYGEGD